MPRGSVTVSTQPAALYAVLATSTVSEAEGGVLGCPFPRCDRISGSMLPNCHPIGRCLLHREFGNASSRENNPAPEILPRTPPEAGSSRTPPLPRLFAAPLESRFSQRHGPRGRGVLPRRGGMARRCRAAQTDALPALQGCRHADSARVSIRV